MKTLHLTNSWHETSGGIATFYRALIEEANRRAHEIRLIVPAGADRVEQVSEFGRIYHLGAPKARLNSNYRVIYPSQFIPPGSKIQQILAFERPDLVEISDKYTLNYLGALLRMRLVQRLNFRPLVVGLSQERMDDNFRAYLGGIPFSSQFCSVYMKWLYFPFFDHHIVNSEYTADELLSAARGQLVPRGTWVRPMGVDLGRLSPQRRRPDLRRRLLHNFGASEAATLLLYVGRLVPEKNLSLLFDLLGRLSKDGERDYRLLVVGEGIERDLWESRCAEHMPGRAVFFGHIHDKDVLADLYANSDVFVHPNPREPFGIAPLEAMASGLPLVAPNAGGVTSYANPLNAWTVPPDVKSYVAAVDEIVTDRAMAAAKTLKAIEAARQFGWATVAVSFLELYEQLKRLEADVHALSAPAFCSTPARGLQAAMMRAAAHVAKKGFQVWTRLAPEADSSRISNPCYPPAMTAGRIEVSDSERTGLAGPPYRGHFRPQ
jgi:alpha-1,6-mannosyltransferase